MFFRRQICGAWPMSKRKGKGNTHALSYIGELSALQLSFYNSKITFVTYPSHPGRCLANWLLNVLKEDSGQYRIPRKGPQMSEENKQNVLPGPLGKPHGGFSSISRSNPEKGPW